MPQSRNRRFCIGGFFFAQTYSQRYNRLERCSHRQYKHIMSKTFISIDIDAPVETVFAALANIETFPDRAEAIASVEFLSDQKRGVGTRFRETRIMKGPGSRRGTGSRRASRERANSHGMQ